MHPNVQRLLNQITERLETAATQTVEELAREGASILATEFDANRRQTRRAAKWRKLGAMQAEVGLFFARRFTRNKNAFTYREFERIVRNKLRPALQAKLVNTLNSKLHR